jgi:hypothetical protein
MAEMISVCFRDTQDKEKIILKLKGMNDRLTPENITFSNPKFISPDDSMISAVFNPNSTVHISGDESGFYLGEVFEQRIWNKSGTPSPDGTYAMIRSNNKIVEAITDAVASRTLWYYFDQEKWIVSTSQRAIVMFLGSFEFNEKVIPWMLSAGNLGPGFSWDNRIKHISPNTIAKLDRMQWKLNINKEEIEFNQIKLSDKEHRIRLEEAIKETFGSMDINANHWVLPLSGGYDSRALLMFLMGENNIRTITWGTQYALNQSYSDAVIAKKLAQALNIKNTYFTLDNGEVDVQTVIKRFIENGEGRIDHISGYIDGFSLWQKLYDAGVEGTIRGDVPWPTSYPYNMKDLRGILGFRLWDDYENLPTLTELGLPQQNCVEIFSQKDHETLEMARDRLYNSIKMPFVLSALNDLKSSYGELMSPFLSKNILKVTFTLPDHLRNNKFLFKEIVNDLSPPIAYAKYKSNIKIEEFVSNEGVRNVVFEKIANCDIEIFSQIYIRFILEKLRNNKHSYMKKHIRKAKARLSPYISKKIKKRLRNHVTKYNINFDLLAFRTVIIIEMYKLLCKDKNF